MKLKNTFKWILSLEWTILLTVVGAIGTGIYYAAVGISWLVATANSAKAVMTDVNDLKVWRVDHTEEARQISAKRDAQIEALIRTTSRTEGKIDTLLQIQGNK